MVQEKVETSVLRINGKSAWKMIWKLGFSGGF